MRTVLALLFVLLPGCAFPGSDGPADDAERAAPVSPYAGEETRAIKAIPPEEIEGYRTGAGLGYAKSAELNHYPGPLHALELADELELSEEQRASLRQLRADMLEEAVPLGGSYLVAEAAIEEAFRRGDVDAETLRGLIERAHAIEAQLRFVHLDAHLTTRALMTPEQVREYDALRGYGGGMAHDEGSGHSHG